MVTVKSVGGSSRHSLSHITFVFVSTAISLFFLYFFISDSQYAFCGLFSLNLIIFLISIFNNSNISPSLGRSTKICVSKRRRIAASKYHGKFVAAITVIFFFESIPSIICKSVFTELAANPVLSVFLSGAIASNSSINITEINLLIPSLLHVN